MSDMFSVAGKKAIVTGASRGLGRGMAQGLHNAGVELALIDVVDHVQDVADQMGAEGARVFAIQADLSNRAELGKAFQQAVEGLGGLDILLNNVGITRWSKAEEMSEADWDIVLEVNLNSLFFMAQHAGQYMLKQGHGKIINIASLLSFGGGYLTVGYAASKGGVAQMTKALANEWSSQGVNVNAIAPGYMATEMNIPLMEDPARNKLIMDRVPAARWGLPEDLVGALIFLASPASDYVHGILLPWMAASWPDNATNEEDGIMILDKFRLDGKIAIVTGSRRNLGKGMAIGLAEAGADIVSFDRNDPTETRQAVQALGRRHLWKQVDLLTATPEDFTRLIAEVVSEWGSVDILVNNAGICPRENVLDYPEQYWNDTLQTNLIAPWFLAQAAARQMVKQGSGKIINIASLLSHQGGTIVPGYTASKHGILGFTKALANDLASKGVNVNSITPGYMHTELTEPLVGNPKFNLEARMPAKRWGTAEDLKGAVVLLASEAGDYIHGADIAVDGGWLAW